MLPDVLLLGLGNPGKEYSATRHNFGFMILDARQRGGWQKRKKYYYCWQNNQLLVKPRTFMNLSGEALTAVLAAWRIKKKDIAEKLLVILDDYQIPFGEARLRQHGGDGGHNGLRSVIAAAGQQNFWRLRLGIGPLPPLIDPAEYVLQKFNPGEREILPRVLEKTVEWLQLLEKFSIPEAVSRWPDKLL
jgi:PTH1 family peptidyl-tRNA hydrolase